MATTCMDTENAVADDRTSRDMHDFTNDDDTETTKLLNNDIRQLKMKIAPPHIPLCCRVVAVSEGSRFLALAFVAGGSRFREA